MTVDITQIACQRFDPALGSSVESLFTSAVSSLNGIMPEDAIGRSINAERDRIVAAVAAIASRATAPNPVIVRCLVMGTLRSQPHSWVSGNRAEVQRRHKKNVERTAMRGRK